MSRILSECECGSAFEGHGALRRGNGAHSAVANIVMLHRYYEGGISSVYLWDMEDGFAGCVLLKKCTCVGLHDANNC